MQTATEWAAYTAAAIDGEGSISVARQGTDDSQWRRSPTFTHRIQITNTVKPWLEMFQGHWGGTIHLLYGSGNIRNRKPCWVLIFRGAEAKALLSAVLPYLFIKRRQAELLLEFFPLAAERKATSRSAKPADPELVAKQQAIHAEIKKLNARGVVPAVMLGAPRSERLCVIDGCGRKHYGRGYCWRHYRKNIVRGGAAFYERTCVQCEKPFIARRSDTKCCSKTCGDKLLYSENREQQLAYAKAYRARKKLEKTSSV